jgi:hypothetical protein
MGEIKSTLDLVMERTRHLSLSAEEKTRQQRSDFEKRVQGALEQYAEELLSVDSLRDRIAQLQMEHNVNDPQIIVGAIFKRIEPSGDNERWLEIVKSFAPESFEPLQKLLSAYQEQREDLLAAGAKRMSARLAQDHRIEGSAVVPNPSKDAQYQERITALRREVQTKIDAMAHRKL